MTYGPTSISETIELRGFNKETFKDQKRGIGFIEIHIDIILDTAQSAKVWSVITANILHQIMLYFATI